MKQIIVRILYLVRDAKFCVKFGMDDAYRNYAIQNKETILRFDNMYIVWSSQNTQPCPSYRDIENVDLQYAEKYQDQKDEDSLVSHYKEDLALKALYIIAKKDDGLLTFKKFIQIVRGLKVI